MAGAGDSSGIIVAVGHRDSSGVAIAKIGILRPISVVRAHSLQGVTVAVIFGS